MRIYSESTLKVKIVLFRQILFILSEIFDFEVIFFTLRLSARVQLGNREILSDIYG